MSLKRMQMINFHDDVELQCHVSTAEIEMIINTKQMFLFLAEYPNHELYRLRPLLETG